MALSFTAQVDAWVRKSDARMLAVFKAAVDYTVSEIRAGTPVVTGFLKNSFTVNKTGPVPASLNSGYTAPPYKMVIAGAKLGDTIYGSFAAVYAMRIEYGFNGTDKLGRTYNQSPRGMVRKAVQNWPQHVAIATTIAKARVNRA